MDKFPVNPLDAVVLAVLILSALMAFTRGLLHEILSIGTWIGAVIASLVTFPITRTVARSYITNELMADAAAAVLVFLVALIVLSMVCRGMVSRVRAGSLSALDRSLGFLFGLVRGALFVCGVWLVVSWLLPLSLQPGWIREARTLPAIELGGAWLAGLLPGHLRYETSASPTSPEQDDILRRLTTPRPAAGRGDGNAAVQNGARYGNRERSQIDQLIETAR